MSKFNSRAVGVLLLGAGWAVACGGSNFNAGGSAGSSATGGSTASGGSGGAGAGQGGASSSAGSSQAGNAPAGSSSTAGSDVGGSGVGGSGVAGSGVGGSGVGGSSAGTTSVAGGAAGGARNSGDCDGDADCSKGEKCVTLSGNGFRTCAAPVTPPETCGLNDKCCTSTKPCAAGTSCVPGPLGPSCGGAVGSAGTSCVAPACASDADCSGNNAVCVPAGALGRKVATCVNGGCRRDADCKELPGGKCEPVQPQCCSGPTALYCVYPGIGCRSTLDCTSGACVIQGKNASCSVGGVACPG